MTEPVMVCLSFRNDGGPEPNNACITQLPMTKRGGIHQDLTPSELSHFGENLTMYFEAEFDGEGYDLIRPITLREVERLQSYRCDATEDLFQ